MTFFTVVLWNISADYVPGVGHGRCVTFGRIAGINAAGGDADKEIPSLDI